MQIKFRGKRIDNGEWVYGDLVRDDFDGSSRNIPFGIRKPNCYAIEIIPETIGQLRYEKDGSEYYDGDVYYHAGYGNETVSAVCRLQYALYVGESQDIERIVGNVYDNPNLLQL